MTQKFAMADRFNPSAVEQALYQHWEENGYFKPSENENAPSYCIAIPPPNVTGSLHMGHAFQQTLMDTLIRFNRMEGHNTLWQAGTDHAGIATQMVVERKIAAEEGKTRHDYGREAFINKIWDWKAYSGGTISQQMRRLGNSIDWERERFTMDDGLSNAVKEVFVRLHEEGLIYRGKRLVNWDPKLHTAISDLEVENKESKGSLWHFRYPLANGAKTADGKDYLVVATTRPETMLGDTAVAVHPEDERYQSLIGKTVVLPLANREIPIIADEYVDREFGTGVVKITPAHDFNDYEVGKRHSLPMVNVLTLNADIRDEADYENPVRIVLVPRSNRVDTDALMAHLFATTDLEKSYRVNMNMIGLDHKPAVKGLLQVLTEWLTFRRTTVTRRLQHRLDKVLARLHILDGLMIAFLNIDEVIEIIRTEDEPKQVLMTRFNLSDEQAEAILNLRLRHLAKLEEHQLQAEKDKLEEERSNLELILGSERRLNTLIKKEIQEDAKKYASPRMSQLVEREEAKAISESEMTPAEPVTVILSEMGWVRCAKGHDIDPEGLSYKAGDKYLAHACGKSNQPVIFIDSTGRSYALDPLSLPSARSQGEPLTGKLTLPAGATIEQVIMEPEKQELLMASDAGYGFICKFEDLIARNKAGKTLISLPENAKVLKPETLSESASLLVSLTSAGRMLIFPVRDLPALSKGKGNKIISIPAANAKARSELLVKLFLISEQASLEFHSGKRKITLKPEDLQKFRAERGRKGSQLPRGLHSNVDIVVVEPEHNS